MNKVSILALLTCITVTPVAIAEQSNGIGSPRIGVINFSGSIYENSCQIINDNGGNKTVSLPVAKNTALNEIVPHSSKAFSINVRGCGIIGNLKPKIVWLNGRDVTTNTGYLENKSHPGANNVALAIMDKEKKIIDLNDHKLRFPADEYYRGNERSLIYTFHVGYIKTNDSIVTAGPVTAQATYGVTYL